MPISSAQINLPAVRDELKAIAELYEAALVGNNRELLDALFHPGPDTLRYGLADEQYGFDAVVAFRAALAQQSPPRRIVRCEISTYGQDFGTVNLEFRYTDRAGGGRQSQTWVRSDQAAHGGWRIVAAHVSLMHNPAS
ncbi:nuclear transport factor 2 family protein [Niveibacterium sp. 24ML]|uniref:AtzH-like domain-containing protein n=1 Tax=Niveibacterium sp. 24ML TaxID=2985512 RepID=UPI00226F7CCF|nr:AtzH-like domain-containing protein [Niveibacterium sp. 24ML]MCX9154531.1 nuclear transport factor 2 family protein [Niveibacterium sp. 24ML]